MKLPVEGMKMDASDAAALVAVSKTYGTGPTTYRALADVSLAIEVGDFVSIMGPSGSGKSTMLNLLAGIDTPTSGTVVVAGRDLTKMSERERCAIRLRQLGFVFQNFNLFPSFTIQENIAWPLEFQGVTWRAACQRADAMLERVHLPALVRGRRPAELSGGEQQRVAIARALVTQPVLLLADEPTGNLDSKTGLAILELLRTVSSDEKITIVLVTHSDVAASYSRRRVELSDGQIARDTRAERPAESVCYS